MQSRIPSPQPQQPLSSPHLTAIPQEATSPVNMSQVGLPATIQQRLPITYKSFSGIAGTISVESWIDDLEKAFLFNNIHLDSDLFLLFFLSPD